MDETEALDFLNNVQREYYNIAKLLWWLTKCLQGIVLSISVVVSIWSPFTVVLALLAAFISIVSAFTQWWSDHFKGKAQQIHRQFELWDGLGFSVSPDDLRDIQVELPKYIENRISTIPSSPFAYFASQTASSPKRSVENLNESTFFSKFLARYCGNIYLALCVVVFSIVAVGLVAALQNSQGQSFNVIISKVVVSVLGFIFTSGLFRNAFDYYRFADRSKHLNVHAGTLLRQANIEITDALKLVHEYQLARATSPLIHTRIWEWNRDKLNNRWKEYTLSLSKLNAPTAPP